MKTLWCVYITGGISCMSHERFGEDSQTKSANMDDYISIRLRLWFLWTNGIVNSQINFLLTKKLASNPFWWKKCRGVSTNFIAGFLVKKHGHMTVFGKSMPLFSQPYKSIEYITYQWQVAALIGVVATLNMFSDWKSQIWRKIPQICMRLYKTYDAF